MRSGNQGKDMDKLHKALRLASFLFDPRRDIEIFGMFGPGNLGDEAMLVSAQKNLPQARLIPWQSYGNYPLLDGLLRRRQRKHLLVGGGTLIHGGNTGWLDYVEARFRQGVRVSFLGTGMAFTPEQISSRSSQFERWREILMHSDEIHLRGPYSAKLSTEMCGRGDIFGDFAFLLHRDDLSVRDQTERCDTIGINLGNCLGDQQHFEESATTLVRSLASSHRLAFHVVVASDLKVTHRVIEQAGLSASNYHVEKHYFDPYAFMKSIRNYRAFLGLKLHAAGLAMICGVPSLMIAYLPKCFDFTAVLPESDNMLLNLPLDIDVARSKINQMLDSPHQFTREKQIAEIAAAQRETLDRIFISDD